MANDIYFRNAKGNLEHCDGQNPAFPIEKGSAIVAYAYMPHSEQVVCEGDNCYIPLDLMADGAATDWLYSGRVAKSKDEYREEQIFKFDFAHAMMRLDIAMSPQINEIEKSFQLVEVALGVCNHGKGRLFVEDGLVEMDTASYVDGSIHYLQRKINHKFSIDDETNRYTELFFLMPYTKIHELRIVGIWNEVDTIKYEYVIADSAHWDSNNLRPGTRSVINVTSTYNR